MHRNRIKSITLVILQIAFIGILFIDTSFSHFNTVGWFPILVSIGIIIWAFLAMRKSAIKIFPEPAVKATLVTSGPYKHVRHPMYTSVLLACSGLVIGHFTLWRVILLIGLTIVLVIKLLWEEKMLVEKFEDYKDYKTRTKRLFPFLY